MDMNIGFRANIRARPCNLNDHYFIMASANVVIIPVDGSKNSDRAVDCKSLLYRHAVAVFGHVCVNLRVQ